MLGRQLLNQYFDQSQVNLDLSKFKNGVYFIKIQSNGISEIRKIIKTNCTVISKS